MDLLDLPVEKLRKMNIAILAMMNARKTKIGKDLLDHVYWSGYNFSAYNHVFNVRDGPSLRVNCEEHPETPAVVVNSIEEVQKDLQDRMKVIMSKNLGFKGENGILEYKGFKHKKFVPLIAYVVDELFLFLQSEKDVQIFIQFMDWSSQQGLIGIFPSLRYDYRHEPITNVESVIPYFDLIINKKAICQSYRKGKKCSDLAAHTQRLWSIDYVKERGLGALLEKMEVFDFESRDLGVMMGKYVPAPYFDKTVSIENPKDKKLVYIPVCDSCSRLPYKEEVFQVYDALVEGKNPQLVLEDELLTKFILEYLTDPNEKWVRREESGLLVPIQYVRNRIGGFSARI